MASAWGKAWGNAWNGAWGAIASATSAVLSGGIGRGGGGYLVELDAKPKRETITLYDEEAEILELLAAIMPVIHEQQRRQHDH